MTDTIAQHPRRGGGEWLTPAGVGVVVTLVSLYLALLGYGYALAVESMFSVSETLIIDSPLDYLRLSSHVVTHWVTGIVGHHQLGQLQDRLPGAVAAGGAGQGGANLIFTKSHARNK